MRPGDRFLGYRLLRCVGVGGISEVWAARHEFLGRDCALKFLQIQNRANAGLVERAKNEAIALSRLRHVNLVQVTDAGITAEGVVWMAMPLLSGMSLREYLVRHGRLPIADALRFAREVCDGARAAHEVGIVHRDLKPENVFLTDRQEIVVLDLGVAKFQDIGVKSTGEGRGVLGTIRYMSPEHVSSRKIDHRTDQYSVGVMLYEMLHGEHPFHRGEHGEELDKFQIGFAHTNREPRPLTETVPGLPGYVWELVERAMRKRPEERFATMADLAGAIRTARKRLISERRQSDPMGAPVHIVPVGRGAPAAPAAFAQATTELATFGDAVPHADAVAHAVAQRSTLRMNAGVEERPGAVGAPVAAPPQPAASPVVAAPTAVAPPAAAQRSRPGRVVVAFAIGATLAGGLQIGSRWRNASASARVPTAAVAAPILFAARSAIADESTSPRRLEDAAPPAGPDDARGATANVPAVSSDPPASPMRPLRPVKASSKLPDERPRF